MNGTVSRIMFFQNSLLSRILFLSLLLPLIATFGCKHDHMPSLSTGGHDYLQVNLVADTAGFNAGRVDPFLDNPWGIAISAKGSIWISGNHSGRTVIYDANGVQTLAPVAIPFAGNHFGSSPTGAVYNTTTSFVVNGKPARFIYATEEGTIATWNTGDSTITSADRSSSGALYKGLTIANDGTGDFIYAADFLNGKIDVFDKDFNFVTNKPFKDSSIPAGFTPFNIRNIGGKLFVTYAKQKGPDNHDDESGAGNGFINVFNPDGTFVRRFASQGVLNSPWGIVQPAVAFGQKANAILVGNFGDGRINIFDSLGTLIGPLENDGIPITINGLWDIGFSPLSTTQLYFTAGPGQEAYGLFGYLKLK
jgi:uncharacterized protein (TIGR03118 family)